MDKKRPTSGRKNAPRAIKKDELDKFRKRKQRSRVGTNISLVVTVVLVFTFVSLYMVSGMGAMLRTPIVATITPDFGNVAAPRTFSGVIIRDETTYTADRYGILEFYAGHLERVRPDQQVASIKDETFAAELGADIEELDRRILEMQARRGDISAFSADVARMNDQLQASVDSHLPRITDNNFNELYNLADNTRRLLNLRNQMLLSENRGSVRDLASQREQTAQRLSYNTMYVTIDRGGILSYLVDGLEDSLTPVNMHDLTPEQTRQTIDHTTLHRAREVSPGDPLFKIVNSNTWFIALYMPFEIVADWQINDLRRLYIQYEGSFRPLETYVQYIRRGNTNTFVIVRVSRFLTNFMDTRGVNIRLTNTTRDSLRIPAHVVTTKDALRLPAEFVDRADTPTPTVIRSGRHGSPAQTVPLSIFRRNSEFIYVLTHDLDLAIGDTLIAPNEYSGTYTIDEIITIHGVFVLNFGFADFIEIHLSDEASPGDGHIILETASNRRLTPASQIILDPTGLRNGQRLIVY